MRSCSRFHQRQRWYDCSSSDDPAKEAAGASPAPAMFVRCRQGRHFLALAQSLGPHIGYHAEHHFKTMLDLQKQVAHSSSSTCLLHSSMAATACKSAYLHILDARHAWVTVDAAIVQLPVQ